AGQSEETLRRIQRRLAHAGSHCRDRSFPGDDVGGISERRPCYNPSRFRQKILDSRNSGYSRPTKKAKRSRMLRDELPEYPATAVRQNVLLVQRRKRGCTDLLLH